MRDTKRDAERVRNNDRAISRLLLFVLLSWKEISGSRLKIFLVIGLRCRSSDFDGTRKSKLYHQSTLEVRRISKHQDNPTTEQRWVVARFMDVNSRIYGLTGMLGIQVECGVFADRRLESVSQQSIVFIYSYSIICRRPVTHF